MPDPIDPVSHAIGQLQCRLDAIEGRQTETNIKIDRMIDTVGLKCKEIDTRVSDLERFKAWGLGIYAGISFIVLTIFSLGKQAIQSILN